MNPGDSLLLCAYFTQGDHNPGKPGILRDFYEHGKRGEFCVQPPEKIFDKQIVSLRSNICVTQQGLIWASSEQNLVTFREMVTVRW